MMFGDIEQNALNWLNNNQLSYDIWNRKYRYNNESFEKWLDRVSGGNQKIRELIFEKKFLFGGRILANRGLNKRGYANCNSLGFVDDSVAGIMKACSDLALTYKAGAGQGVNLSHIRPKGSSISSGGTTDGVIPFLKIMDSVTGNISRGGDRRGALLAMLDAEHGDILDFINVKRDKNAINNANLSVSITKEFMQKVKNKDETALKTWDAIAKASWDNSEPGIIYWDEFTNYNIMEKVDSYQIESCNGCSEIPMPKGSSCLLSSCNLRNYVISAYTSEARFDFDSFISDLAEIVKEMDNIITETMPLLPLPEQRECAEKWRPVGIGIMGLANCLSALNIKYGSQKSLDFIDQLGYFMFRVAVITSSTLAREKGSFPGYSEEVFNSTIIQKHFSEEEITTLKNQGLRNSSLLSLPPTGSTATMLNISTGIEPYFALSYVKKTLAGGLNQTDTYYTIDIDEVKTAKQLEVKNINDIFITAHSINYVDRIKVQSKFQEHIDQAISSTINLPKEVTEEQIKDLYYQAFKYKLKGVTIFRDGSREPILSTTIPTKINTSNLNYITPISREELGSCLLGQTFKQTVACGNLYVTINKDSNGNIVEIFSNSSRNGTCKANLNGVARAASLALRSGVKVDEVIDQLKGIHCQACQLAKSKGIKCDGISCPDVMAKCLQEAYTEKAVPTKNKLSKDICPECGTELIHSGGCVQCSSCGYSKCG